MHHRLSLLPCRHVAMSLSLPSAMTPFLSHCGHALEGGGPHSYLLPHGAGMPAPPLHLPPPTPPWEGKAPRTVKGGDVWRARAASRSLNRDCGSPMSSIGTGYDQSTTTFSPDGRVFQIEYAAKAVENSGTAVGIRCKDGVVLGVEKQKLSKMLVPGSNRRVYTVDKCTGMAVSGMMADARQVWRAASPPCFSTAPPMHAVFIQLAPTGPPTHPPRLRRASACPDCQSRPQGVGQLRRFLRNPDPGQRAVRPCGGHDARVHALLVPRRPTLPRAMPLPQRCGLDGLSA